MHIKLISPRSTVRPMDSAWKTRMSPPLALLVLGALTPRRHTVTVADENVERVRLDDWPDLVAITVKVDTADRAAAIARRYRLRGIPVVVGGIHPTACPAECTRFADAVVVGEAEYLWSRVLADVESRRLQTVYENTRPVDPADIPIPRWELLAERKYLFTNTVRIGRGCPWRCAFCYNSSPNIDSRYRMKPIGHIVKEIVALGTDHVMFIDDNFIGNPVFVRRLIPELKRMGLTWHAAVSADVGRHDGLLDAMADSGCKSLFIGFESVSERNLKACRKAQNRVADYDATVRKITEGGMLVNASVVFGFDGDDPSVFDTTLQWLVGNRISTMTAHILTPYPGTPYYRELQAAGRIIDHDLSHYNTSRVVFRPLGMSTLELVQGYHRIYTRFYSWSRILARLPESAAQRAAYLQFNLIYRKYGKLTAPFGRLVGMRPLARLARRIAYRSRRPRCGFGSALRGTGEQPVGAVAHAR